MRQLIQSYRSGEMKVEDVPPPTARSGGVLVRTVRSLVSAGTEKMIVDLAKKSLLGKARARPDLVRQVVDTARKQGVMTTFKKVQTKLETPIPLGYSSAGIVVEVGENVSEFQVGDRVACAGAGYANHADYNYVPRNLVARVPDGLSMDLAASATVGAIALQGVRQVNPTLGERVAVLGLGLIGQITVQLLAANGCRVLGYDPDPTRAALARELGAHASVSENVELAAERFTKGQGIDAVIIAASTPSSSPLTQAAEISRLHGRVVVVGLVGMEVPRSLYYRKELDLRMSMSYGPGRYDPDFEERGFDYPIAYVRWTEQRNLEAILDLAKDGRIQVDPLITHRYSIENALDAYGLISSGDEPFLGILLEYDADDEAIVLPKPSVAIESHAVDREQIGIGMIGAGGFGQSVMLPALKAVGGSENIAIASAGGMTARRIGQQYGFRVATSDPEEIIQHPDTDAIFVLTRHNLHAPLVIQALEAGKHVFTEKPLALTPEEIEDIAVVREGAHGDVMVGFNRRFSSLAREIAEHFEGRTHPLVMTYRVNAGYLPPDHWVHDPVEGGGRIMGEVCHFVDLLQYLADAPPVGVSAESISGDTRYRSDDNVIITIRFGDGSVGTVIYTAMGDSRLPKEYLEVFGEGRVAILKDFRSVELISGGRSRTVKSANQDKGFEEEISQFLHAVRTGGPMPIPFEQSAATTRVTLAALEALQLGKYRELGATYPARQVQPQGEAKASLQDDTADSVAGLSRTSLMKVYNTLPASAQSLLISAASWTDRYAGPRRYAGTTFQRVLQELERSDEWDADQIREDQERRLRQTIRWAVATVPFYSELFRREGIDPDSIRTLEDLQRIPFLEKETVRMRARDLRSNSVTDRDVVFKQTSGTTGTALALFQTPEALAWKDAVTMRQRGWFGVETGDRYAVFGGQMVVPFAQQKPPFWRYDRASRRMRISAYHMKPEFMQYYADELRRPGYVFWQGYPSAIGLLCQYLLDEGLDLGDATPRAVFPSSETLLDFHRDRIARVTTAPIADLYANAELSVSVVQCPEGQYHVDTEFCTVEIDPHEETDEWVRGEVISTGFADRAMPFIRYRTGDIATMLKNTHCPCGRSRPILERIDGRIEDYVVTPDGRRIGRLDNIFKGALEVKEAQIIQKSDRRILVRMVPRPGFDDSAQMKLEEEFRARLGDEIEIDYETVDAIPRGEDGKFRAVVSDLRVGRLQ